MADYKLPRCWVGQPKTVFGSAVVGEHTEGAVEITEADCNPKCHCLHPMQAHFCMEGHMTECHAGMSCSQAECMHYLLNRENEDEENY